MSEWEKALLAPDPRDELLERAAKLIKSVIDNDPHVYWPNGDDWLAALERYKEEEKRRGENGLI